MSSAAASLLDYFVTCNHGLEAVVAGELAGPNIGARDIRAGSSGVWFRGTWETGYRANLWMRSGIRVLVELSRARVRDPDELYEWVRRIEWQRYMRGDQTLAVDARVWDSAITHSHYAALKVKDAICDRFRDATGARPNVEREQPDLPLFLYVFKDEATLYRDLSGMTLHKRGYRSAMHRSSLNEAVAAGILLMAGWNGEGDFLDPMAGSGTFAIEAALIALGRAPGLLRKRAFPFEKWPELDAELWNDLRAQARANARTTLPCRIMANDVHPGAVALARQDLSRASLDRHVELSTQDVERFTPPVPPAWVFTNPPWGERLEKGDPSEAWRKLGRFLKRACPNARAFVLSGSPELTRHLAMRATRKTPLAVGKFDCRVLEYQILPPRPVDAAQAPQTSVAESIHTDQA